jgi:AraC-like DNA-binding protein
MQFPGVPPMHYLASWRIELGSPLLRETRRTVASIALDVGHQSVAAFSRAFRRLVGLPPAAWHRSTASPRGRRIAARPPRGHRARLVLRKPHFSSKTGRNKSKDSKTGVPAAPDCNFCFSVRG